MNSFKDILKSDMESVFFNLSEFAEQCTWNRSTIKAVIDDDSMIRKYSAEFDALPQGSHLVYAPVTEFTSKPKVNESVQFNNNVFVVNEIKEECGMICIFLANGRV